MNTPYTKQKLSAKLTYNNVKEIKSLIWDGRSQASVAGMFGVSQPNINRIVHGFTWQNTPWPNGSTGALNMNDYIRRMEGLGLRRSNSPQTEPTPTPLPTAPKQEQQQEREQEQPLTLEQRNKSADIMEEQRKQIEADMELEIAQSIKASGKSPREGKKREPLGELTAKEIPWEQVQKQAPRNTMVVLARVDEDLRKCICVAFRALPLDMWNTPKAEEVVKQVGVNLGIEIKGNFFKVKE